VIDASTLLNFRGQAGTATVGKPVTVFRGQDRKGRRPAFCKAAASELHENVEARPEARGSEAFQEMFVTSRPQFLAMARTILRNQEDAEDAVQNAFLSGYRNLRNFEGRSALKTWFTRIVLNAALMIKRKHKPSLTTPFPEPSTLHEVNWAETIPDTQPDPERIRAKRELVELLNKLLEKMAPSLRQAFTVTYYDELSGPEACARLGISAGTFKARLFRARRHLLTQAKRARAVSIRRAALQRANRLK